MAESAALVVEEAADGVAMLTLNRPSRHNALVPELVEALVDALGRLGRTPPDALVLRAAGPSFSTGGDVAGFAALPRGERRVYADRLVGGLNRAILALVDLPCPVIVRLHGPVTGGSCGLVLAADLVAIAPRAFLQPYHADVGFAPDGGWTALMPERIGTARAGAVQLLNRRIGAEEALSLGLATAVAAEDALDGIVAGWLATLKEKVGASLAATKALLMPPARRQALADGLERERARFLALVETHATEAGMARFLRQGP